MDKAPEPIERSVTQTDLTLQVDDDDDKDDISNSEDMNNELKNLTIEDRKTKKVHDVSGYL